MSKQQTALSTVQTANGGKMVDFHGWEMPVQFTGITDEHAIVRNAAGCFDLGHMGRLRVQGADALAFLERRITRPLASMKDGQVRYGLVCNESGTVEDDVLVSRESADAFHIVVNASNRAKILDLWSGDGDDAVTIEDLSEQQGMLAVQGPESAAILAAIGLDPGDLRYYRFSDCDWRGTTARLSRTGYTGEDGCECFVDPSRIEELWQSAIDAGAKPCGLGSRDTLRLEAGMPLYGNELDDAHTPIEAGLGFAVGRNKTFIGSQVLHRQLADGSDRCLVGLRVHGKRPARAGYGILHEGDAVGQVTSGTLSPTLGYPIAMGYIPTTLRAPGTRLQIDIRGKTQEDAEVIDLPFYQRQK